jgi:hypothetical protein
MVRMARCIFNLNRLDRDTALPRDDTETSLHNPNRRCVAVRTGILGKPLRKGKTVEHAGSSISLSELSQDSNSVVPIDAVRDPSRITRKKRPRAHADRHLRVSDVLTVFGKAGCINFMQLHADAPLRRAATSSMTARTTRPTSRPKTGRRLSRLSWVLL